MKKCFLLMFVMVFLGEGIPAHATDNIIIINPDGSVREIGKSVEQPTEQIKEQPKEEQVKPAPEAEDIIEEEEPTPEIAIEAPSPSSKPVLTPQKVEKKAPVQKTVALPPKPTRKPIVPKTVTQDNEVINPQENLPVTVPEFITEKQAKRIALEIAPPALNVDVSLRRYQERGAYLVRFKAEQSIFDVLVDVQTGEILATKDTPR